MKDEQKLEARTKFKLLVFAVCFTAVHIYLFYTACHIINLEIIGKSDPIYVDGSDFSPLVNLAGALLNKTLTTMSSIVTFIVNALLFTVFITIFNKLYFRKIPRQKMRFAKIIKIILTSLSLAGAVLLILINLTNIRSGFSEIFCHYLLFCVFINLLVRMKLEKSLKKQSEDATHSSRRLIDSHKPLK